MNGEDGILERKDQKQNFKAMEHDHISSIQHLQWVC